MDPTITEWWTSVAGVAGAATLVGGIRMWLGDKTPFNRLPLVVYNVLSCFGLTLVARHVMNLGAGETGAVTLGSLLVQVATATVLASGVVSVATNAFKPLAATVADARRRGGPFVALVLALGLSALGIACAGNAAPSPIPEVNVSLAAERLVTTLDQMTVPPGSSPVERLVDAKLISVDEAIVVAGAIKVAMTEAKNLALALDASYQARQDAVEHERALARASAYVRSVAKALAEAPLTIGTEAGRRAVAALLQTAADLLLSVSGFFPMAEPPSQDFLELYAGA